MPTYLIYEKASYEVEERTAQGALEKFLTADLHSFPCTVTERRVVRIDLDGTEVPQVVEDN